MLTRTSLILLLATGTAWSRPAAAQEYDVTNAVRPEDPPKEKPKEEPAKEGEKKEATSDKKEEKKEEKKVEPPKDRWFAVSNGDIYTGTGEVLRGATLVAKNGKIHKIGLGIPVPEDAQRIDATGLRVYPGMVACASSGIVGFEPVEDNTDVFSLNFAVGLGSGLSTVVSGNTAAKLTYGTLEGLVLKVNLYVPLRFASSEQRRQVREELQKIRDFNAKKAEYDRKKAAGDKDVGEEPKPQGLNAQYVQIMQGQAIARFDSSSASELSAVARLVTDFGFKAVVFGATEGWVVADELGRAGISCVISPRITTNSDPSINRINGSNIENARILHESGVKVAVVPRQNGISLSGLAGRDLMTLPMEAAYAVRGGLPHDAAVDAITLTAARVLGVADRIGSLEVGKDADFVVTDGDILDYQSFFHFVVINGRLAYDKSAESLFSHIKPLPGEPRFLDPALIKKMEAVHPEPEAKKEGEGAEGDKKPEGENKDGKPQEKKEEKKDGQGG